MLGASAAELEWSPAPFQRLNEILGGLGGGPTIFGSTAGVVSWHATALLTKSVAAAPATRVARETRAETPQRRLALSGPHSIQASSRFRA